MRLIDRGNSVASGAAATAGCRSRVLGACDAVGLGSAGLGNRGHHLPSAFPALVDCGVPGFCECDTGHRSTTATQVGNITLDTRSWLERDGQLEESADGAGASSRLRCDCRSAFVFPSQTRRLMEPEQC